MWNGVVLLVVSPKENGGREGAVVKGVKWDWGEREGERGGRRWWMGEWI
jgi:hypothetical protein